MAAPEDIARTCHAHPTFSEAVREGALSCGDGPIHSWGERTGLAFDGGALGAEIHALALARTAVSAGD